MALKIKNWFLWLLAPIVAFLTGCPNPSPDSGSSSVEKNTGNNASYYMGPIVFLATGKTLDRETSNAISNLRISLLSVTSDSNTGTNQSDTNGEFSVSVQDGYYSISTLPTNYTMFIDDVDGITNGNFDSITQNLLVPNTSNGFRQTNLDFTLKKK